MTSIISKPLICVSCGKMGTGINVKVGRINFKHKKKCPQHHVRLASEFPELVKEAAKKETKKEVKKIAV